MFWPDPNFRTGASPILQIAGAPNYNPDHLASRHLSRNPSTDQSQKDSFAVSSGKDTSGWQPLHWSESERKTLDIILHFLERLQISPFHPLQLLIICQVLSKVPDFAKALNLAEIACFFFILLQLLARILPLSLPSLLSWSSSPPLSSPQTPLHRHS